MSRSSAGRSWMYSPTNALKYSRADVSPAITVRTAETGENGKDYDVVLVRDNGIGFEPEYAERIFQMFARLHRKAEYIRAGFFLQLPDHRMHNMGQCVHVTL